MAGVFAAPHDPRHQVRGDPGLGGAQGAVVLRVAPLGKLPELPSKGHVQFRRQEFLLHVLRDADVSQQHQGIVHAFDGKRMPGEVPFPQGPVQHITKAGVHSHIHFISPGIRAAEAASTETSAVAGDWAAVQPKITAFEVKEAKVKITVAGMMRGLNYKVSMGGNLDEMESFEVKAQNEDGKAFFIIDPKDARFFKVVAE